MFDMDLESWELGCRKEGGGSHKRSVKGLEFLELKLRIKEAWELEKKVK